MTKKQLYDPKHPWIGMTYPHFIGWKIFRWFTYRLWKRFLCSHRVHLFDEMLSSNHVLVCDACGLQVHIAFVETEDEAVNRAKQGLYIETTAVEKCYENKAHRVVLKPEEDY